MIGSRETKFKLKKVKPQDLQLFKDALNHYVAQSGFFYDTLGNKQYGIYFSISVELWYHINLKTQKQDIPEKTTLKLSMHQAVIFSDALDEYSKSGVGPFEKAVCFRYKAELDSQLPWPGQLLNKG